MKILIVHNFYQLVGGEDAVVTSEMELLRRHGHDVALHSVHNNDIRTRWMKLRAAVGVIYNFSARKALRRSILDFQPNIIHLHNFFPLLSPSVLDAARVTGVPVVMTLHNFRTLCPTGVLFLDGKICERSLGGSTWWAIPKRVYHNSLIGTFLLSSMIEWHKYIGTWRTKVARFITLTPFAKQKFREASFPESLLEVKPNAASAPSHSLLRDATERAGALFVGRLSEEKGLRSLIEGWREIDYPLRIAGDGPMASWINSQNVPHIERLGHVDEHRVRHEMLRAMFLIIPSVCYEMFPVALAEAFGCGLPIIASRLGGVASLIEADKTGLLFTAGDAADLRQKVQWAIDHPDAMAEMGRNARAEYEHAYTPEANYTNLLRIYTAVHDENRDGR